MDNIRAMAGLGALAQATRLETFKLLVRHEPGGVAAGAVARALGVPQNTMSAHLAVLARAGLVTMQRDGRSLIYRADLAALRALMMFLVRDCCAESQALCIPLVAELTPCR